MKPIPRYKDLNNHDEQGKTSILEGSELWFLNNKNV
jgi:hypothetical protein